MLFHRHCIRVLVYATAAAGAGGAGWTWLSRCGMCWAAALTVVCVATRAAHEEHRLPSFKKVPNKVRLSLFVHEAAVTSKGRQLRAPRSRRVAQDCALKQLDCGHISIVLVTHALYSLLLPDALLFFRPAGDPARHGERQRCCERIAADVKPLPPQHRPCLPLRHKAAGRAAARLQISTADAKSCSSKHQQWSRAGWDRPAAVGFSETAADIIHSSAGASG